MSRTNKSTCYRVYVSGVRPMEPAPGRPMEPAPGLPREGPGWFSAVLRTQAVAQRTLVREVRRVAKECTERRGGYVCDVRWVGPGGVATQEPALARAAEIRRMSPTGTPQESPQESEWRRRNYVERIAILIDMPCDAAFKRLAAQTKTITFDGVRRRRRGH